MIKKSNIVNLLICSLICFVMFFPQTVYGAQAIKMNYDGKTLNYTGVQYKINVNNKEVNSDFPGIVFNKVTMFPLRAVFEHLGGKVVWNSKTQVMDITYNGTKLQFKNNSSNATVNGKSVKLSSPAKKINERLVIPIDFIKNIAGHSVTIDTKTMSINFIVIGSVKTISVANSGEKDIVTLEMSNHDGFEVMRLTNPNRIVIDFKNVKSYAKETIVKAQGKLVNSIRVSEFSKDLTRIVLDMKDINNYSVVTINGGCKITVQKPINPEFKYVFNQDRKYIAFRNIKLADVGATITNYFTEEYDVENNKYIMTIPENSSISLAAKTYEINNELVNNIEIFRDKESNDTKIVFNTKNEFKFFSSYNEKYDWTEINLLTPAKGDERIVVIDAGHGGKDPGATVNNTYEKDLNLDIALRLEKLLKEKNVKTFMLRQDDTFVSLYDRPYIANELNAALFLSIHNNAIDSKKINGTETLYFPEKAGDTTFTGQKFAQMIQTSLISKLKTYNRKTVERPNLVVLKYTKMPSSLAEISFMTNTKDLQNLKNATFRQNAAQGLCDAIVKSLAIIEEEAQAKKAEKKNIDNVDKSSDEKNEVETEENIEGSNSDITDVNNKVEASMVKVNLPIFSGK